LFFSKYVEGKREIWNEKKLTEDERWQEIFRNFKQEDTPLKSLAQSQNFPYLYQEQMQVWEECLPYGRMKKIG
jgi:hypothetical protein